MKFEHQQTGEVMKWFEEITKIPHGSKEEGKLCAWLADWAKKNKFEAKTDKVGNLLIKVPGTAGYEKSPAVVFQGHLDMVCEKTPDSKHDFTKDPLKLVYDGDWLKADKTTLGADNGIGMAIAMSLALDKNASHPPLELLFTVDEETGLTGASALGNDFITGKNLINLDSEKEGSFTVGCAGGVTSTTNFPVELENIPAGCKCIKISAAGLKGGHSGLDINAEKANAIIAVARTLNRLLKETHLHICDIKGGSAHNAIPRDAEVAICVKDGEVDKVGKIVSDYSKILKQEFKNTDPGLEISAKPNDSCSNNKVLTDSSTKKLVNFMLSMPHGVAAMSTDIKDLVETSNNFASIAVKGNNIEIITSQRSSRASRLTAQTQKIEALVALAGASMKTSEGYPGWAPNMNSELLKKSVSVYESLFRKKPIIEALHAGLECGLIGEKYSGMDMLSVGPTIEQPHSPNERVNVKSIGSVYDFLKELLKALK